MRHSQEGSGCSNCGWGHGESSFDGTADDRFVEFWAGVTSSALIGMWQCAGIWLII